MVSAPGLSGLPIGILTGPTATGKTELALKLAECVPGLEIINADSLLVFREMDIGTAKPSPDELARVPHHLIDIRTPGQDFTAADFTRAAHDAIAEIDARGGRALIVGGSGFYLKALIRGIWDAPPADLELRAELDRLSSEALYQELFARDEESALRITQGDRYRLVRAVEILRLSGRTPTELQAEQAQVAPNPRFAALWVIDRPAAELELRIIQRAEAMVQNGIENEARGLEARYPGARALSAVGYREALRYIHGDPIPGGRKVPSGKDVLVAEITLGTRQLAKAQRTWFRGQREAQWFVLDQDRAKLEAEFQRIYGDSPRGSDGEK